MRLGRISAGVGIFTRGLLRLWAHSSQRCRSRFSLPFISVRCTVACLLLQDSHFIILPIDSLRSLQVLFKGVPEIFNQSSPYLFSHFNKSCSERSESIGKI